MTSEFWKRAGFTVGALLVFRLGSYIPLPGINLAVWREIAGVGPDGILQAFNASLSGATGRLAIFALGIMPYVSAAIVLQILSFFVRRLRHLREGDDAARRRFETWTRALALILALFQGFGVALALEGVEGVVESPGALFEVSVTLSLVGGTMFLVWLAGQITLRGLGNGIVVLLAAGIVLELPKIVATILNEARRGFVTENQVGLAVLAAILLVAFASWIEGAWRNVPVVFTLPANGATERSSVLSFKLNNAGVMPALLASWFVAIPLSASDYFAHLDPAGWSDVQRMFAQASAVRMGWYAVVVIFFVYFYTAFVVDPSKAAESLQKYAGAIPGVAPGEPTAEHLDNILSRVTLIGAIYFAAICLVPELLLYKGKLPFYLAGTSLLTLVCAVKDLREQARCLAPINGG